MLRRTLLLLLFLLFVREAAASYTEAHLAGVDVRVVVGRDGRVAVTHGFDYRVLAGTFRSIAITGFADDWRFSPTAKVTSSDARVFGATVTHDDKGVLHVTVDDPKGLKRGDYRFEIAYEGELGSRVTRDGAFDRLRFALPTMREGIDGARVVFALPPAPTEPRAITEGDMAADITTLRRSAEHDELELVRPHVPKGEAAAFLVRVDPKALPQLDPALRLSPAPPPPAVTEVTSRPPLGLALLACVAALVLFGLGLAKERLVRGVCMGLLPGPATFRTVLAATSFGAGVLAQARDHVMLGAGLVALALPLLAWRAPPFQAPETCRQGTWLVLPPDEAFTREVTRTDLLDAATRVGAMVLGATLALLMLACWLVRASGALPYVIAMDAFVLVPIFFTGTRQQAPPSARREGEALAPIAGKLRAYDELRVAPLARVGEHGTEALRLLVSPRLAMTGVSAIEVGVAWERAGGTVMPSYDVLVRVHDDSFAAAKMTARFPQKRVLPGRKPDERVYRFEPEWPSVGSLCALVLELADVLRDRRLSMATDIAGRSQERRLPPKRAATRGASLA